MLPLVGGLAGPVRASELTGAPFSCLQVQGQPLFMGLLLTFVRLCAHADILPAAHNLCCQAFDVSAGAATSSSIASPASIGASQPPCVHRSMCAHTAAAHCFQSQSLQAGLGFGSEGDEWAVASFTLGVQHAWQSTVV